MLGVYVCVGVCWVCEYVWVVAWPELMFLYSYVGVCMGVCMCGDVLMFYMCRRMAGANVFVFICGCMYVWVCMCVCWVCMYVGCGCVCVNVFIWLVAWPELMCLYSYVCVCMWCMYGCVCVSMYVCGCVLMFYILW